MTESRSAVEGARDREAQEVRIIKVTWGNSLGVMDVFVIFMAVIVSQL